jgi:MoxR-like ATPase
MRWAEADELRAKLQAVGYFLDRQPALDAATWLALRNGPLIAQGAPGSGKTALFRALAAVLGAELFWLQCYESVSPAIALYRWNEPLQRLTVERASSDANAAALYYDARHLIPGKLAQALLCEAQTVMVVLDEVDKPPAGGVFEASLLEFLETQSITVNETRQILRRRADLPPILIGLTSNAGPAAPRLSLSDPLLRRSYFLHFDAPDTDRLAAILAAAVPNLAPGLNFQIARFVERAERAELQKPISLSETVMWAQTLAYHSVNQLTVETVAATLAALAKGQLEIERLRDAVPSILNFLRRTPLSVA